jgi:hypothetical protein
MREHSRRSESFRDKFFQSLNFLTKEIMAHVLF